jgi:hypothetical protein
VVALEGEGAAAATLLLLSGRDCFVGGLLLFPPSSSELLLVEYLGLLFLFLLVPGSTVSPRSSRSR